MKILELHHPLSGNRATINPERGGIVTHLRLGGRERLYLDEATLADPTKNVRGGIPLLFPSPGKLEKGRYTWGGKSGEMKQHGFARDLPWTVVEEHGEGAVLALVSNATTRAMYPWDFALTMTLTVTDASLDLAFRVQNKGGETMPFGLGIHPYFRVVDKAAASITTAATRAFDNVTKRVMPFHGFDLTAAEVDMHLFDHGSGESTLTADASEIHVRTRPDFARWVVWTLAGKEFVCLEPWTAPGDALNTGEGLITLGPGEARTLEIVIADS